MPLLSSGFPSIPTYCYILLQTILTFSHNIINGRLITHSYALGFTAQDGLVTTPYMTMYLIVNTLRYSLCCTFTQYHGLFMQDFIALLIEIDPRRGTTTVAP